MRRIVRILVHGLCAWFLTFAVLWGLADVLGQLDVIRDFESRELGNMLGTPTAIAAVVTMLLSALFQAGMRVAAWSIIVLVLAGLGVFGYGVVDGFLHPRPEAPLTEAERAQLEVVTKDGKQRLLHSVLGFSLLHPGSGFSEDRESADAAALEMSGIDAAVHIWIDPDVGALTVAVIAETISSRQDLERLVDRMVSGLIDDLREDLGAAATARTLARDVIWERDRPEAHVHSVFNDRMHARIGVYPLPPDRRVVLVMTFAVDGDALAAVNASFRR